MRAELAVETGFIDVHVIHEHQKTKTSYLSEETWPLRISRLKADGDASWVGRSGKTRTAEASSWVRWTALPQARTASGA